MPRAKKDIATPRAKKIIAPSATFATSTPTHHLNTRLPLVWTFRFGANVVKVVLICLAIYCDIYHRYERLPSHEWLSVNVHPWLGAQLPMFSVGGLGYLVLHHLFLIRFLIRVQSSGRDPNQRGPDQPLSHS
jgi:hypothetical protein